MLIVCVFAVVVRNGTAQVNGVTSDGKTAGVGIKGDAVELRACGNVVHVAQAAGPAERDRIIVLRAGTDPIGRGGPIDVRSAAGPDGGRLDRELHRHRGLLIVVRGGRRHGQSLRPHAEDSSRRRTVAQRARRCSARLARDRRIQLRRAEGRSIDDRRRRRPSDCLACRSDRKGAGRVRHRVIAQAVVRIAERGGDGVAADIAETPGGCAVGGRDAVAAEHPGQSSCQGRVA